MARTDFGGMGWILLFVAGWAILQKKGVAQAAPLTTQQRSWVNQLPSSTVTVPGSNSYVAWVQESLNKLIGAGLIVDGVLGPRTREAVMKFQSVWGLSQTGIVDAETDYGMRAALGLSPYIDQPYQAPGGIVAEY